jgi:hypothetical protein
VPRTPRNSASTTGSAEDSDRGDRHPTAASWQQAPVPSRTASPLRAKGTRAALVSAALREEARLLREKKHVCGYYSFLQSEDAAVRGPRTSCADHAASTRAPPSCPRRCRRRDARHGREGFTRSGSSASLATDDAHGNLARDGGRSRCRDSRAHSRGKERGDVRHGVRRRRNCGHDRPNAYLAMGAGAIENCCRPHRLHGA